MNSEIKIQTHSQIHKRIIAKTIEGRPEDDLTGLLGKYNDELFEIYSKKRQQFLEATRQYNRLNQETLFFKEERLQKDYQKKLDCSFLDNLFEVSVDLKQEFPDGNLIRARTERPVHTVPGLKEVNCSLESWFKRKYILNKFIWAARTVILKIRLETCLGKLKELKRDDIRRFESMKPLVRNISYANIFEKYL